MQFALYVCVCVCVCIEQNEDNKVPIIVATILFVVGLQKAREIVCEAIRRNLHSNTVRERKREIIVLARTKSSFQGIPYIYMYSCASSHTCIHTYGT